MPSKNSYAGYVKLPEKDLYHSQVRLDFNVQIESGPEATRVRSYNLRLFTLPSIEEMGKSLHPEIAVSLSTEQWIDLIEAMRRELEISDDIRGHFEK